MRRLTAAFLTLFSLSACAIPAPIAGYAGSYDETFMGTLVARVETGGKFFTVDFAMDDTGVRCSGRGKDGEPPPPGALRAGTANLSCSDGRSVVLKNEGTHVTGGKMQGKDNLGRTFFLYYDMDSAMISSELEKFRREAKAKGPSAPLTAQFSPAKPAPTPAATSQAALTAAKPVAPGFRPSAPRPDDIAVIIGNADYRKQGQDIPDVIPAHADAEGMKRYAIEALGIREGNIIFLKDATGSQLARVFGSEKTHRGQLFDWVKPGKSRVFVYYAGHGAPGEDGNAYLVPTDSDASRIEINGYPLSVLYANLAKLPAENITVVLESCFSGASQAGSVISNASPIYQSAKKVEVPANLTVIAAGGPNQMASWEEDKSHGLFTKYFLLGMAGEADKNKDGQVSLTELDSYLKDTLTYYARRYYGRDQIAVISGKR